MNRYLSPYISKFLKSKFLLLSGPRQVGKTTIAKEWLRESSGRYLNWDISEDRKEILLKNFTQTSSAIVLDEIHKYSRWKNLVKGLYDKEHERLKILVTGSARLDVFKKGGDSLFGRYEKLRLHPFSIGELTHGKIVEPPDNWLEFITSNDQLNEIWGKLETLGGFPEPYLSNDKMFHNRWSSQRQELLLKQDLRDLSQIRDIDLVEHLSLLLPDRIGSPLSLNALRQELQVAHGTISSWLDMLDHLYITYRLSPYSNKISRSLRKEQKLYLWDWSQISDPASKFENIVASHLLKNVHLWTDLGFGDYELRYCRDKEKREVDFIITNKQKPLVLIEAKLSETVPSKNLLSFSNLLGNIPMIQLVAKSGIKDKFKNTLVASAAEYLSSLN